MDPVNNLAYSRVTVAPDPADSGTTVTLITGDGNVWAVPFNAVIWPRGAIPTIYNAEIVRVIDNNDPVMTIERAQEGTTARAIEVGDQFAATISAELLNQLLPEQSFVSGNIPTDLSCVQQGAGSIVITGGELFAAIAETNNPNFFVCTAWGNITFGDGTAGEAGQPIVIDILAIINALTSLGDMNTLPWGPKGMWMGQIANVAGVGVFNDLSSPSAEHLTLCGFGALPVTEPLQTGDNIYFNLGSMLIGND